MANQIKEKQVKGLIEELKGSEYLVVTDYQGMTAIEFDAIRAAIRPLGAKYRVVKNRLAKISFDSTGFGDLKDSMKGPSAIAYLGNDGAGMIRELFKFSQKYPNFKVKAGKVFGITADAKSLKAISDLPSREVLLSTLLARMNSPLTNLAGILTEPLRSLQCALSALVSQKEKQA